MTAEPPKIIVDDDWKSQVEKEKQMAAQPKSDDVPMGLPPNASFETLLTMLFTQGMAALGQMPGEDSQLMPVNKPIAKHFIDTIEMLGEKTKGNLTDEESTLHAEILHALRITFVQVKAPK